MLDVVRIKVSNKMCKLRFHPCTVEYIKNVCKGSCCRRSNKGALITVQKDEMNYIKKLKVKIKNNMLVTIKASCPFQDDDNLCKIHDKQLFGCMTSPFMIRNNVLIVRYRYISMKCYNDGKDCLPVYRIHKRSLDNIFGLKIANEICFKLNYSNNDFHIPILKTNYNKLVNREKQLKRIKNA
jgi:hypothetical protein